MCYKCVHLIMHSLLIACWKFSQLGGVWWTTLFTQPNLQTVNAACENIDESIQDRIWHAEGFVAHYLVRERIACQVAELMEVVVLWFCFSTYVWKTVEIWLCGSFSFYALDNFVQLEHFLCMRTKEERNILN